MKQGHSSFFLQLAEHLTQNKLSGVLGLQILDLEAASSDTMLEFVLGERGTERQFLPPFVLPPSRPLRLLRILPPRQGRAQGFRSGYRCVSLRRAL